MDEALKKSGEYPNIAMPPNERVHAATGEFVEIPESARMVATGQGCPDFKPIAYDCKFTVRRQYALADAAVVEFEGYAPKSLIDAVIGAIGNMRDDYGVEE